MYLHLREKIIFLIILGTALAFSPIISTNLYFITSNSDIHSGYNDDSNLYNDNLKPSNISGKVYISGNSGWSDAKTSGICTGEGIISDPYIIKDLIIDTGGLGSGILVENSDVFFRIENCTVYNSAPIGVPMGGDSGIMFHNTNNSQLINNNFSSNFIGIRLSNSYNNTISGNTANNNGGHVMEILYSNNNTISGNTVDSGTLLYFSDTSGIILFFSDNNIITNNSLYRGRYGINLRFCRNITVSKNKMYDCGLNLYGDLSPDSIIADTTNLVNGKPIYYYNSKVKLGSDNFTNAGQVILYDCHDSSIENLNTSYGSNGISLDHCNNNSITGNIAIHNKLDGISLSESYYNNISENTLDYNEYSGIDLYRSYYNVISKNNASDNYIGVDSWICGSNNISGNILNNNSMDGVYLYDSTNYFISNNIINSNEWSGMFIYESNTNILSNNTVNGNILAGIYLLSSDYNNISGNILIGNCKCIKEEDCEGNIFINNTCVETCVEKFPLELIIVISIVSGITVIGVATIMIIRHIRKKQNNSIKIGLER
jgi:parallel beta-helix repeat protein